MFAADNARRSLLHWVAMRAFWKVTAADMEAKGAIYEAIDKWRCSRRQMSLWYERDSTPGLPH